MLKSNGLIYMGLWYDMVFVNISDDCRAPNALNWEPHKIVLMIARLSAVRLR